ncbi:MAG: hypothetical protein EAZ60_25895 [Oscillatoriales cyanobacterium]|nr:MAG: hypothetical protein EAZ60_25895 [Oscillatoriales cyanobacterium]
MVAAVVCIVEFEWNARSAVSLNYAKIKKPGFWENLGLVVKDFVGLVVKDFGRNPVSLNSAKIKKPGFWENLGLVVRDFGRNPVSGNCAKIKNRVSKKI